MNDWTSLVDAELARIGLPLVAETITHNDRTVELSARTLVRFLRHVGWPDVDDCWPYGGHVGTNGYGRFLVRRASGACHLLAHRAAYQLFAGPIPDGLTLDHLCRNRPCVNPAHLEPVTVRENLFRAPLSQAFINAAKVDCLRGHPLVGSNVYITSTGGRRCRECSRRDSLRRYHAHRRESAGVA
jgi:hypothetical protein